MTSVLMVTPYPPQDDGIGVYARALRGALEERVSMSVMAGTTTPSAPGVYPVISANPWSCFRAGQVFRRSRPQVIHFQFNVPAFGLAWLWVVVASLVARRKWNSRLVFTLHEVRRDVAILGFAGIWMYRIFGRVADTLVVYTAEARDLLVGRCGADRARVKVMPHGCPSTLAWPSVAQEAEVADRYQLGHEPVLCLGYLHPDKGIEHLIEAVAMLSREDPDLLTGHGIIIAGKVRARRGVFRFFERRDRRYEAALRSAVSRHQLESVVRFVGSVDEQDMSAVLRLAYVAVLPYNDSTQSGVLNLLLAAGTPVVASRLPGLAGTLGGAGLYFTPGDPAGLAHELRRLLVDRNLHHRLAEQMATVREGVTYSVVAASLAEIYESLL